MNFKPTKLKLIIALVVGLALGFILFNQTLKTYYRPNYYPMPCYPDPCTEAQTFSYNFAFQLAEKFAFFSFLFGSSAPYFVWSLFQRKKNGLRSSLRSYIGTTAAFVLILSALFIVFVKLINNP